MGERPRTELLDALKSLFQSRDYADLVLVDSDGTRHRVHCALVCSRSKLLSESVQEGDWREHGEHEIDLSNEDPDIVRLLIDYLYLLDYEPPILEHPQGGDVSSSSGERDIDTISSVADDGSSDGFATRQSEYGHVYGTSAISAFGGPSFPSPYPSSVRSGKSSSLTVHALPGSPEFSHHPSRHSLHNELFLRPGKAGRSVPVTSAPDSSPLATKEPNLTLHARMFAAGCRFGVEGLKALAGDKLKIQLTRHWDSAEFAEAIHIIFASTPNSEKDVREVIANTIDWHPSLLDKPEIEFAIMEINGLAYELLKRSRRPEPEYMT